MALKKRRPGIKSPEKVADALALQARQDRRLDRRRCKVKKGTLRVEDVAQLMVWEQVEYARRLLS